jgi:Spy/CpxP family protein refolding chaperone
MKNNLLGLEEKMKYISAALSKIFAAIVATVFVLTFSFTAIARAQDPDEPPAGIQVPADDPIASLRLTPEQREKIRVINQQNRAERARINQQLASAQAALAEVLDSDSPNESFVEQRIQDVANAQAAHIRMRVANELRIRSVLTPDQLKIWREIRNRQTQRRRLNNPDGGRRDLPNQRNGLTPLYQDNRRNPGRIRPRP